MLKNKQINGKEDIGLVTPTPGIYSVSKCNYTLQFYVDKIIHPCPDQCDPMTLTSR